MTNPNEPTLTCSEVVERLAKDVADELLHKWPSSILSDEQVKKHIAEIVCMHATQRLHSWRERRVQELEELLAKHSGCSHCNDSASISTGAESSTEIREGEFEIKQLIEEARDCIRLYRDRMLEFSDIDALEWKAKAAEKAMRGAR